MKAVCFAPVLYNLMHDIEQLLKPSSLDSQSRKILKLIYNHLESFEEVAKRTLDSDLDIAIWEEVCKLKRIVSQYHSTFQENKKSQYHSISESKLKEEIDSSKAKLKMKEQECSDGLYNTFPDDEDDDHSAVSSEMIGVREVYEKLKDLLMRFKVTSIVGMPGIGKTTLANKLFNDPMIVEGFDHRVWIRVGKKYLAKDIPRRMLEVMDPEGLQMLPEGDEEAVREHLKGSLKNKRYLIVLDDVWDRFTMLLLYPQYQTQYRGIPLDQPFLHPKSESRILITGRLQQLNEEREESYAMITMRLLNKEESWDLLRETVFFQRSCPPQMVKAGKKISENCDGLPLTILAVARLLSQKKEKCNPEYWYEVATKKNHQIFLDAYDEISKVLLPSYTYLPPLLQMCFMFIGLFPPKYEIPRSKLVNLWLADRFYELNVNINFIKCADSCLEELISNSIVMVYQKCSYTLDYYTKTCGLHSSLWHLSKKKARETKFALLLSSRNDGLGDGIEGHHRLSFHNNILFGIKEVHKSVEDNCASAARSLYCFAPYLQYQVPLCFRLKLLKELDAHSIRFYEFPMEVLELVHLVYLSLTSNGMIPTSIYRLRFLEFLIVDRHQNIKQPCKDAPYLPAEIWCLQELKHLQIMGSDLPNPCGALLSSLVTLSDVSARSCTEAVLEGLPKLENLKIRSELAPDDDGKSLISFDTHRINYLSRLFSFKFVVANPAIVTPLAPISCFPKWTPLLELSLSGLGYPWKEMGCISSLWNLRVLKLKNYAFQGSKWEVEENKFSGLWTLVIEDTDLVDWKFGSGTFEKLMSLKIKHSYKLKKICGEFGKDLEKIELVDCNPSCVDEIKKAIHVKSNGIIDVHSSWKNEKLKNTTNVIGKIDSYMYTQRRLVLDSI